MTIVLALALAAAPPSAFQQGRALEAQGDLSGAARAFEDAAARHLFPALSLIYAATDRARLGDSKGALDDLQRCADQHFPVAGAVEGEPAFAKLAADPRWPALLQKLRANTRPCELDGLHGEFDFWLGSWNVMGVGGMKGGTSKVEKVAGGCALRESWTSALGTTGTSLNAYDAQAHQWRQFWTDTAGGLNQYAGNLVDGAMRLEGTQIDRVGRISHKRMTYSRLADGKVRQLGETSADGKTWSVEYDLTYVPSS